jgi:error-prone DNA polymerase
MGFYSPSQLVRDLKRHGGEVRPVDVNASDWDCTLEAGPDGSAAMRLGLRMIRRLSGETARRIVAERPAEGYAHTQSLVERTGIDRGELGALASAGALKTIEGDRHRARWAVAGVERPTPLFASPRGYEPVPMLKKPSEAQDIVADYRSLGLTLERHPICLLRDRLNRYRYCAAGELGAMSTGQRVSVAGLVITKQRPGTASGVTFVTLEDETGHVNLIVWKAIAEQYRAPLLNAKLLGVRGEVQVEDRVIHVIARQLVDHTDMLGDLDVRSRDFH